MKKIILGTVQFGLNYGINNNVGRTSFENVLKILNFSYDNGIRYLDTAEAYGDSHERIGKFHSLHKKKTFKIITKFCLNRDDLPNNFIKRVNQNIETLKVKNIYCYMFHNFSDFKSHYILNKSKLHYLKSEKIIEKIGVSVHSNLEVKEVLKNNEIDLIQVPYNLLDNFNKRNEIFLKAKNKNVEIHTRSVFLQGLFFKKTNTLNGRMLVFKEYLDRINNLFNKYKINDIALNYAFSNSSVDGVLFGVDNVDQLKKNLLSIKKNNFDEINSSIDKINFDDEYMLNPANWKE